MSNLRENEAASIRAFVQSAADEGYLSGRVLDYGCGKQPYRDIVEAAGGEYCGFDRAHYPANVSGEDIGESGQDDVDAVLCTQVLQYVPHPRDTIWHWRTLVGPNRADLGEPDGYLVLTYPTHWPEVESEDLHRFTKTGMERMLTDVGFEIIRHDFRHGFQHDGISFACGYGVIARA